MRPARAPRDAHVALAALTALVALASLAPLACGGDVPQPPGGVVTSVGTDGGAPRPASPAPGPGTGAGPANAGADAGADAAPGATAALPPLPLREFQERDFAESDQNRDPFRSYATTFVNQAQARTVVQRKVLVDHYALDELKLVGIVTRAQARALLTDPGGLGWVAKVGDFVGKAELVHAGGPSGTDVAVNWRVDRIREGDVVFIREDPSHPEIPPTTRVMSLRPTEDTDKNGRR